MKKIRCFTKAASLFTAAAIAFAASPANSTTVECRKVRAFFEMPGRDITVYHQSADTLPAEEDITKAVLSSDKNHYYIIDSQKGKVTRPAIVGTTYMRSVETSSLVQTAYDNGYKISVKHNAALSYNPSEGKNLGVFGGGIRVGIYNPEDGDPYGESGNKTIDRSCTNVVATAVNSSGETKNSYAPVNTTSKLDMSEFANGYVNLTVNVHDAAADDDYFDYDGWYITLGTGISTWYGVDTYNAVRLTDRWGSPRWFETFRGVPINDYVTEADKLRMRDGSDITISIPVSEFTRDITFNTSEYKIDFSDTKGLNQAGITDDGRLAANYFPGSSNPDPTFNLEWLQFVGALWYNPRKAAADYDTKCGENSYITVKNVTFSDDSALDTAEVVFDRPEDGTVNIRTKFPSTLSGKAVYSLYNGDGSLHSTAMQDILSGYENSYTFTGCTDDQTVRLFAWNNTSKLLPLSKKAEANVADVQTIPDVLRVTSDGYLAKKDGVRVQLKGVNFGGWLIQETWMCPVFAFDGSVTIKSGTENGWANLDTLDGLESRLGKTEAAKLIKSYQDNYITEWDFKNVKSMGFNCIRIPFWYRNFMSDENGTYITANDDDNPGFQKLDWACDMADKYGLYVILDMHGCPGGQSGDHSTGKVGRNYLYYEEKYKGIMEELWVRIAGRYKGRACVAAYDIMNEPLNNADTDHNVKSSYCLSPWSDGSSGLRVQLYDRMIKAIREVDPYHVITVEGIWRLDMLPDPKAYGWTDMMYQLHSYDSDDSTTTTLVNSLENARKNYGVAAYMGEFNPVVYNKNSVEQMNNYSISYTVWNYKTATPWFADYSGWGLYNRQYTESELYTVFGTIPAWKVASSWDGVCYSLKSLSDDEIKQVYTNWWTAGNLATENFTLNSTLKGYLK